MPNLLIPRVDLELLENQRLRLVDLRCSDLWERIPEEQQKALEGILNMLDSWADIRDERHSPFGMLATMLRIPE